MLACTITYTLQANISSSATGSVANTATVAAPGGVTDPDLTNNSATDTDTLTPQAELAITKTDGVASVTAGGSAIYSIVATNSGPSAATGATVTDTAPAGLTFGSWSCVASGGSSRPANRRGHNSARGEFLSGGTADLPPHPPRGRDANR